MARWKVTARHYLHAEQYGQPTEWERQETNVNTGRLFRKTYNVPMFIDPDDPQCINRNEGFCVVARKGTEKPGDIVFFGPPTPDMEPMDDGAQAETDGERHKWVDPINSLPMQIGEEAGKVILQSIEQQIAAVGLGSVTASLKGAGNSDIADLKALVAEQQKQIQQLMDAKRPEPVRVDDVEPLPSDRDPDTPPAPPPIKVDRPRSAGLRR